MMIPGCDDRQTVQAKRMKAVWEGLEPFPTPQSASIQERESKYYGPLLDSKVLFFEQAEAMFNGAFIGTGIDVFAGQAAIDLDELPKYDWKIKVRRKPIQHLRHGAPKTGGTWEDIEIPSVSGKSVCRFRRRVLDGVVVEMIEVRDIPHQFPDPVGDGVTDEAQTKRQAERASKARGSKAEGGKQAVRFGFCKGKCKNRSQRRLLLGSLCPICRGVDYQVKRDGTVIVVRFGAAKITKSEERRQLVETARQDNPRASIRELSNITFVPKSAVSRYLMDNGRL